MSCYALKLFSNRSSKKRSQYCNDGGRRNAEGRI